MECKIDELSQYVEQNENKMEIEKGQSRRSNNQLTEVPEKKTNGNRLEEIIKEPTQKNSPKLKKMNSEFMSSKTNEKGPTRI